MPPPSLVGKGKGAQGKGHKGSKGSSQSVAGPAASQSSKGSGKPCKFFGSAKGCTEQCPFSHDNPNSVQPCSFKQQGKCERGDACPFRHIPWTSSEHARAYYASREKGAVELSAQRFSQLVRSGVSAPEKIGKEHVELEVLEGEVEREMQVETYGAAAVKMMEKMGYAGGGLGKDEQGRKSLVAPCVALERASQCALGLGAYSGGGRATLAERAARLADARSQKRQKVQEAGFVQHNLLSDDESSEDERLIKSRNAALKAIST